MSNKKLNKVAIIMGSQSDYPTMKYSSIIGLQNKKVKNSLLKFRLKQSKSVKKKPK